MTPEQTNVATEPPHEQQMLGEAINVGLASAYFLQLAAMLPVDKAMAESAWSNASLALRAMRLPIYADRQGHERLVGILESITTELRELF